MLCHSTVDRVIVAQYSVITLARRSEDRHTRPESHETIVRPPPSRC